jgi:hypothetical protein
MEPLGKRDDPPQPEDALFYLDELGALADLQAAFSALHVFVHLLNLHTKTLLSRFTRHAGEEVVQQDDSGSK